MTLNIGCDRAIDQTKECQQKTSNISGNIVLSTRMLQYIKNLRISLTVEDWFTNDKVIRKFIGNRTFGSTFDRIDKIISAFGQRHHTSIGKITMKSDIGAGNCSQVLFFGPSPYNVKYKVRVT